jgi:serine/threonine protein phosphatase PrpC
MASLTTQYSPNNVSVSSSNILSSHVIQNTSAQDVALSGSAAEFDWLLVADGHGWGANKYLLKKLFLETIDWSILLTNPDFYKDDKDEDGNYINELYQQIQKIAKDETGNGSKLVAQGTTLSVVKIYPDRFECYHIGDSTVKIYESNEENYNKVMETHDHDSNHPDMELLRQRTSDTRNKFGRAWYHNFQPLPNGIRTKNVLTPRVINETTVTMRQSAYIYFDDDSVINMTRSLGHIPSKLTITKAAENNHTLSLAQHSLTKTTFQRDSNKSYCIVAATDGVWDMACDDDDITFANIISTKGEAATEIATFARKRWLQEWNYCFQNLTQKITQLVEDIDDIGVSCVFVE